MLTTASSQRASTRLRLEVAPYWQLARRSFQRQSTYRGATFAGVFTNTVFAFLKAYIFLALYQHHRQIGGLDAIDVVTYTFVSQGFLATTGLFGSSEITDRIRTGDIVSDLYRPLHFQAYWASRDLGRAAFQAIFRGIPPVLLGAAVFDLRLPGHPITDLAFIASLFLAVEVGFGYGFLVSLAAFWLVDARGPAQLAVLVMQFFSGAIVPISFFPGALHSLAVALPFASINQLPIEIFLGKHSGLGLAGVLGQQVLWVIALMSLNELVAARALRRVVVQGG